MSGVNSSSAGSVEVLQQRGRYFDIIQEAIATYDEWMLDDDYEATPVLHKIMKRMRERVNMTDAHDVAAEGREPLIRELCGDEINGGLIRDLCFTVWNICHHPTNADGNADWSNDTLPTVQKAVEIVRGKLRDAAQKVKDTDVAQLNTDRAPDADEVTGDVGSNPAVGAQGVQELQELENDAFRGGLSAEAFAATQGGDKGEAVAWTKEALIEVIMRETTDKIVADGRDHLGSPNALVQGCKFIRRNMRTDPTEGYEDPEGAAKKFAGFIADAILAAAPQPASIAYQPVKCDCAVMCQDFGIQGGCRYIKPSRTMLRKLVALTWNHVTESQQVPSTNLADELIDRASSLPSTQPLPPDHDPRCNCGHLFELCPQADCTEIKPLSLPSTQSGGAAK